MNLISKYYFLQNKIILGLGSPPSVSLNPKNIHHQIFALLASSSVECQSSISVGDEDLFDGVNISGCPQVQAQVHIQGGLHDASGCPLHGVVQAGVHNVLFAGPGHSLTELITWGHRDFPSHPTEPFL